MNMKMMLFILIAISLLGMALYLNSNGTGSA